MSRSGLTHLDSNNRPTMVDVGTKEVTQRIAVAEARVLLPRAVALALRKSGHRTKKGPVFDTAIIAGVMAAKKKQGPSPPSAEGAAGLGMTTVGRFYGGTVAGIKKRGRASKGCGKIAS